MFSVIVVICRDLISTYISPGVEVGQHSKEWKAMFILSRLCEAQPTSFMNLEHKDIYVRKYVSVSGTACFASNLFLIKLGFGTKLSKVLVKVGIPMSACLFMTQEDRVITSCATSTRRSNSTCRRVQKTPLTDVPPASQTHSCVLYPSL